MVCDGEGGRQRQRKRRKRGRNDKGRKGREKKQTDGRDGIGREQSSEMWRQRQNVPKGKQGVGISKTWKPTSRLT